GVGQKQHRRRWLSRAGRHLSLFLLLWLLGPLTAVAQGGGADRADEGPPAQLRSAQPLSDAAGRDRVARLDDVQVRELLIQELDRRSAAGLAGAEPDVTTLLRGWRDDAERLRQSFKTLVRAVPELPAGVAAALSRLPEGASPRVLALIGIG